MKKYSFKAINYVVADAMLPLLCILVVFLSEELEMIKMGSLRAVCNILMVLTIASLHNRASNRLFRMKCSIEVGDDHIKIIKNRKETIIFYRDVHEIQLSIVNGLSGTFVSGRIIEFLVKSKHGKTKLISERFFKGENLQNHPMVEAFNNIRSVSPNFFFYSENDGAFLSLKNINELGSKRSE